MASGERLGGEVVLTASVQLIYASLPPRGRTPTGNYSKHSVDSRQGERPYLKSA